MLARNLNLDVDEALERAAQRLEKHGWIQGDAIDGEKMCLMMALHVACNCENNFYQRAVDHLHARSKIEYLIQWNDAEGRTQDEVVNLLRSAKSQA